MIDDDALAGVLLGLGSTAAEVAATLQSRHIQGVRNTVRFFNPIVRAVQRELKVDFSTLDAIQPDIVRMTLPERTQEACLPPAVKEFLDAFNRGEHPELELPADNT